MKTDVSFWKTWWDERAKRSNSDREVDRGTLGQLPSVEKRADQQFLIAVNPQASDVVLDAGCGTGVNCCKLSPFVKAIVAMDFSEEMLNRAKKRLTIAEIPNVKLVLGNVMKMEFLSDSFDKVVCTSVLQYLNHDECVAALRDMVRVCKHGGTLVIHAKNRTSLYGLSLILLKPLARLLGRNVTPDYYRPRHWYERNIVACGGSIVEYDSFGIFTFVPLPRSIVRQVLEAEAKLIRSKWLTRFGVNYKMTVRVNKNF